MGNIKNTSEYRIKVTVDSNYPYFAANRKYIKTWEDFVFNGKIKLFAEGEIIAILTLNAIPFYAIDDNTQKSLLENGLYPYVSELLVAPEARNGFYINLLRLFVSPDYRNEGIGKSLLNSLPDILLQQMGWKVSAISAVPFLFEGTIDVNGQWTVDRCENVYDNRDLHDKLCGLYAECGFKPAKSPNTFLYYKIIKQNSGGESC